MIEDDIEAMIGFVDRSDETTKKLIAEVRSLRAERDGAIEIANANALDASRWRHIYDCGYIICRVLKDGTVQNLGGSYVGKYAVDDLIAAVKAAHPKEVL